MCLDQLKTGNSIRTDDLDVLWNEAVGGGWSPFIQRLAMNPTDEAPPPKHCQVKPVHIYLLANLICRPIVVLTGEEKVQLATEEDFSGIYLPFEQDERKRFPIVLSYHRDLKHFSPLVVASPLNNTGDNKENTHSVPITDSRFALLPVPFLVLPSEGWVPEKNARADIIPPPLEQTIQVVAKYLHVSRLEYNDGTITYKAKINSTTKPPHYVEYIKDAYKSYKRLVKHTRK